MVNGQRQETNGAACLDPNGTWRTVAANNAPPPGPPPYQQGTNYAPPPPSGPPPGAQGHNQGGPAMSPDTIRDIQTRLWRDGFYHGGPDGQWGPQTSQALASFQRSRGLPATGQVDGQTLAALGLGGNYGSSR